VCKGGSDSLTLAMGHDRPVSRCGIHGVVVWGALKGNLPRGSVLTLVSDGVCRQAPYAINLNVKVCPSRSTRSFTKMLARRLTPIVPAMTLAEAIETTRIHRVAGLTGARTALVTIRPCRAPTTPSRMRG
jgi:hypothetical protein